MELVSLDYVGADGEVHIEQFYSILDDVKAVYSILYNFFTSIFGFVLIALVVALIVATFTLLMRVAKKGVSS